MAGRLTAGQAVDCSMCVGWGWVGGRSRLPRCVAPSVAGCPRYPSLATGARGGFEGSRVGESAIYWVVASCCVRLPSLRPCNAAIRELWQMLRVRALPCERMRARVRASLPARLL